MAAVRIAVVADIHHGADSLTKRGSTALGLMADFARFVAEAKPDAVVDLGDRISDVDTETDRRLEAEVAEAFRAINVPVHHICGNHDRDHLTVADNEAILGQALGHATLDIGAWRIVLWRGFAVWPPMGSMVSYSRRPICCGSRELSARPIDRWRS